jgi:PAS domain-containing protein
VRPGKYVVFFTRRLIFGVLGAGAVSLASAIVGMFVARAQLLEASEWVRHTDEVELAVAACRLHVREAQVSAVTRPALLEQARTDIERIRQLTVDNPPQQGRVRVLVPLLQAFAGDAAQASQIDDGLRDLEVVESSLKDVRMMTLQRATRTGWLVSSANAGLTVILVALMLGALRRQSHTISLVHANLRREGAMLESVLESMVDGIMAVTASRRFLHVNRAARHLLGDEFPTEEFPKARLGGDEFAVLLPNADPSMVDTIAARLRDGLAEQSATETPAHRLSLSVGITFFDPEHPLSLPELMVEADRLMYADKREQRRVRG